MGEVFVYADETGNLDYNVDGKAGATTYFGFGTAIFDGDHGDDLWSGHVLRTELEKTGFRVPDGFHAKNDLWGVRERMLSLLSVQSPRVDTTFLLKSNAQVQVRERGWEYLYKLAWYLHLKFLCGHVLHPDDHLYVVVASLGTKKRATLTRQAIADVCSQMPHEITLCVWDARTAWGLQVADYALWAVHRYLVGGKLAAYDNLVAPIVKSTFLPWGRA